MTELLGTVLKSKKRGTSAVRSGSPRAGGSKAREFGVEVGPEAVGALGVLGEEVEAAARVGGVVAGEGGGEVVEGEAEGRRGAGGVGVGGGEGEEDVVGEVGRGGGGGVVEPGVEGGGEGQESEEAAGESSPDGASRGEGHVWSEKVCDERRARAVGEEGVGGVGREGVGRGVGPDEGERGVDVAGIGEGRVAVEERVVVEVGVGDEAGGEVGEDGSRRQRVDVAIALAQGVEAAGVAAREGLEDPGGRRREVGGRGAIEVRLGNVAAPSRVGAGLPGVQLESRIGRAGGGEREEVAGIVIEDVGREGVETRRDEAAFGVGERGEERGGRVLAARERDVSQRLARGVPVVVETVFQKRSGRKRGGSGRVASDRGVEAEGDGARAERREALAGCQHARRRRGVRESEADVVVRGEADAVERDVD
mmetsp:Transcript_9461/g.30222  ORF Transcript_9461/g.30222 Transcript_9461/m.30222 type:complete len:423 (-) Transcript_9461:1091-2359(-)